MRAYVVKCARNIPNVEVFFYNLDEEAEEKAGGRVIVLRRKGSKKYADKCITLQAHMDMVCYPNNDIISTEKILNVFEYDEPGFKWMKAGENPGSIKDFSKGTTLGADDGIGVATALALLGDEDISDYPIECLFTVQEETDMGGAKEFSKDLLLGRTYINLDAEDATTILYGSAGGCSATFKGDIERSACMPDGFIPVSVSISKLLGGHSGININKGRLNAIKAMTSALIRLNCRLTNMDVKGEGISSYDLRLISMKRDEDAKMNSIPSSVSAIVAVHQDKYGSFVVDFRSYCGKLKDLYMPEESGMEFSADQYETSKMEPLTDKSTDNLLCLLQRIPHGVISMIPRRPNLVETSTNLAKIEMDKNSVIIGSSNRSSSDKSMEDLTLTQTAIVRSFDFDVTIDDRYPSWQPNEYSALLKTAKDVYDANYGVESKATVIHAGLECSYIVEVRV